MIQVQAFADWRTENILGAARAAARWIGMRNLEREAAVLEATLGGS